MGRDLPSQFHCGPVLDDDCVRARLGNGCQSPRSLFQLIIEDESVERDIALDAPAVQRAKYLRQLRHGEAALCARREMCQTEIDRVGSCFYGCAELGPITGGAFYFRLDHFFLLSLTRLCARYTRSL